MSFRLNGYELVAADFLQRSHNVLQAVANLPSAEQQALLDFMQQWFDPKLSVISAQTSGSTGAPKTIRLQKSQLLASAALTAAYFDFKAGQRVLLPLSTTFIAGKMMLVRALYADLALDMVPTHFEWPPIGEETVHYDFAVMVPAQLIRCIEAQTIGHFRQILLGGAALPAHLTTLLKEVKLPVFQGFGMTETVSHIALRRVDGPQPEQAYTVLQGIEIDQDERGCLKIKAAATAGEWVQSNDLIELLNDRQFIWRGRYDNVVNSGGIKVLPEEIEQALQQLIAQDAELAWLNGREFAVSSMPDPRFGESVALWVSGNLNSEHERVNSLRVMKAKLPLAWAPKAILAMAKFPLLQSGKLDRLALRQSF